MAYSRKYGYDFYYFDEYLDKAKSFNYNKMLVVRNILDSGKYEWVWWVNIDSIILNFGIGFFRHWNIIFLKAYQDSCDYFYQCGDDINFKTSGWINDSISILEQHNNIGLTGPINNNNYILTQAFVSRKHMEIFGYFFPENIINWGCDDWYNFVYKPDYFFPLSKKSNLMFDVLGVSPFTFPINQLLVPFAFRATVI